MLTRTGDQFVSLGERSKSQPHQRVDLFISLHFNALDNSTVRGIETFVMTPAKPILPCRQIFERQVRLRRQSKRLVERHRGLLFTTLSRQINRRRRSRTQTRTLLRSPRNQSPRRPTRTRLPHQPHRRRKIKRAAYRSQLTDAIVAGILQYQKTLIASAAFD